MSTETISAAGNHSEKHAEEWLNWVLARVACAWCRNPDKKIYRLDMCRSCYDIRCELKRLHKRVLETNAAYGEKWPRSNQLFSLEFDYKTAIAMAESAQILGRMYQGLLKSADPLECEREFNYLSTRFVKKDLFDHCAFLFEHLSPINRSYLMYLIGKMMQELHARNRRRMARRIIGTKSRKEVLGERAWDTYRVEDDVGGPARSDYRE